MNEHRLVGLETDNLLGFLALLGLLRALEKARPQWSARAFFGGSPLTAHLHTVERTTPEVIAQAAAEGCAAHAELYQFPYADLTFSGADARALGSECAVQVDRARVISALCSDAAVKEQTDRILPTPLCAMFGQGHQSFLSRLDSVAHGTLPRVLKGKKNPPDLCDPAFIYRSLFERWNRSDITESFRWDYMEDRQYALRYENPSGDPPATEHGANRLAIIGMLSFQCAPRMHGIHIDLGTRAASRGSVDRRQRLTWPIWYTPASLAAIHMMLDEPELAQDSPKFKKLSRFGIDQARRVYRVRRGKFISFTRGEALTSETDLRARTI